MTDNDQRFLGYIVKECIKYGVKVVFVPRDIVKADGCACAGFFDFQRKELHVACHKPQKEYCPILIHEFCHFQQFADNDPKFFETNDEENNDLWKWLKGRDIPMARVKKSVRMWQSFELDCEKRAAKHIKNFGLSLDRGNYIKNANIYILFYSTLLVTRTWPDDFKIYDHKQLIELVPDKLLKTFVKVPEKFLKIVMNECKGE